MRVSIDAGQSSIRVRVDGVDRFELSFPGIRTDSSPIAQLARLLAAHDGWGATALAVGLTGYDGSADAASALRAAVPTACVALVAHDSVSGYLGANGRAEGVVAAVGTGVVVLGAGPRGIARVDGWGSLLGDAGSAYWIGRAGLEAVMRAFDGRGSATSLTTAVRATFGVPLDRLYLEIQADPDRVARIASFAPAVTARADDDPVSSAIVDRAAGELVESIAAAARNAGIDPARSRISGTGQVLAAPAVARRLADALAGGLPGATLADPLGRPIDGVELLHDLDAGHPLAGSVTSSAGQAD
ncbi:ATPase [Microbacterium sp. 4R-513]|nr:ATPase [Microbacterium sp. 4R-513]